MWSLPSGPGVLGQEASGWSGLPAAVTRAGAGTPACLTWSLGSFLRPPGRHLRAPGDCSRPQGDTRSPRNIELRLPPHPLQACGVKWPPGVQRAAFACPLLSAPPGCPTQEPLTPFARDFWFSRAFWFCADQAENVNGLGALGLAHRPRSMAWELQGYKPPSGSPAATPELRGAGPGLGSLTPGRTTSVRTLGSRVDRPWWRLIRAASTLLRQTCVPALGLGHGPSELELALNKPSGHRAPAARGGLAGTCGRTPASRVLP